MNFCGDFVSICPPAAERNSKIDGERALSAIGVGFLKVRAGHLVAVVLLVVPMIKMFFVQFRFPLTRVMK